MKNKEEATILNNNIENKENIFIQLMNEIKNLNTQMNSLSIKFDKLDKLDKLDEIPYIIEYIKKTISKDERIELERKNIN